MLKQQKVICLLHTKTLSSGPTLNFSYLFKHFCRQSCMLFIWHLLFSCAAVRWDQARSSWRAPTVSSLTTPSRLTSSTTRTTTAPNPPTRWWSGVVCAYARPPGSSAAAQRRSTISTVSRWFVTRLQWPKSSARGSTAAAEGPWRAPGSPTWSTSCGARRAGTTAPGSLTLPCMSCSCWGWRSTTGITTWITWWRSCFWETSTPSRPRGCTTSRPATKRPCKTPRWVPTDCLKV